MRGRRTSSSTVALGAAGLLLLVIVLVVLLSQRRIEEQIAQTDADLAALQVGTPIAEALPVLPGFALLATVPLDQYGPQVITVYRKSVGRKRATGVQWDICVDRSGRVIEIRREGAGHR